MTIAIHSTNAALAALETLALHPAAQPGAQTGAQVGNAPLGTSGSPSGQAGGGSGDVLTLSDGAAAATLGGLTGGFSTAATAADAAVSAGNAIVVFLGRMRAAAESAANPELGADQRSALDVGFRGNLGKIDQALAGASAGGVNLLDGSAASAQSQAGAESTLTGFNLSLGGPVIGLSPDAHLSDAGTAEDIALQLGQAIDNASQAVGQIAAQGQAIHGHLTVISQAALSLSPGVSTTPDLNGDGARLLALQVQQQLAGGGAAVANQAPQSILALFR